MFLETFDTTWGLPFFQKLCKLFKTEAFLCSCGDAVHVASVGYWLTWTGGGRVAGSIPNRYQ